MLSPDQAKTLVFQHYPLLKKMASAHFGDVLLAEEAFNYVLDHLQEHQWARVCQYANPAGRGVTVFLHHIVKMLLIDFARKSGRVPHIPKWVTERGEFWRLAYRLLIVESQPHEEVRQLLSDYAKREGRQPESVAEVMQVILYKASVIGLEDTIDSPPTPEEETEKKQTTMLLEQVFFILERLQKSPRGGSEMKAVEDRVFKLITQLRKCITLDSREFLLLKMVYQDGLTVSEAGRRLRWSVTDVQNHFRQLLKDLRNAFERCDVAEEFRLLFD